MNLTLTDEQINQWKANTNRPNTFHNINNEIKMCPTKMSNIHYRRKKSVLSLYSAKCRYVYPPSGCPTDCKNNPETTMFIFQKISFLFLLCSWRKYLSILGRPAGSTWLIIYTLGVRLCAAFETSKRIFQINTKAVRLKSRSEEF